ncbi:MAG: type II toxin-antitoxin system HicA family toxin [Candidatus Nanopelagicales bacterium]
MTYYKAKDILKALTSKGMEEIPGDGSHHIMLKREYEGGPTLISRISRGSKAGYDDFLLTQVGKQLALNLSEVKLLVKCPMKQAEWDQIVAERCPDGINPLAPYRRQ